MPSRLMKPLADVTLAVVGAKFRNKRGPSRIFEIAVCRPGEMVELRPEPKNKADPRAIAVYSERGVQLGYLAAEKAPRIGQLIAQGADVTAIFQARTSWGAFLRISFDGSIPDLPPEYPGEEASDFWPDPIYPDE